jgi:hypothetical protein
MLPIQGKRTEGGIPAAVTITTQIKPYEWRQRDP